MSKSSKGLERARHQGDGDDTETGTLNAKDAKAQRILFQNELCVPAPLR